MDHVDAQLSHLQPRQWTWWHEGDERHGDDVGIWGFKCPVQAAALWYWSTRCGIDWSIPPEQADQPPAPPEDKRQLYGPIKMMG
jgi:hypothetical protein